MILFFAIALTGCRTPCLTVDDFVDEWWEIDSEVCNISECYQFTSNGDIILKNESSAWVAGTWEAWDTGNNACVRTIVSNEYTITLQDKVDDCWILDYNNKYTMTVCPCSL